MRSLRAPSTLLLCVLSAFVGGAVVAGAAFALPKKHSPYHKLNVFSRVLTYVENSYVDSVDHDQLVYGAIKGMLETLDPHTSYLTADQYREMKIDTQGEFGGIGIEVEMRQVGNDAVKENVLYIMTVFDNTPAAKAGLQPGDRITKIDGRPTRSMRMEEALQRMRGKKGTQVQIAVERSGPKGWTEPRSLQLTREWIKIDNVSAKLLDGKVGYLRIKQFSENTDRDVERELAKLERSVEDGKLAGLVLDLRNNPGGLLDQAVRVADLFLDSGLIVRTEGRDRRVLDEEMAHVKGTRTQLPIVALVNAGSASAAEIVAGALQDHKRAAILGTQTFGKGSVQTVIELEDGSALKLTIARYFTPSGRSIQERGIEPDLVVEQVKLSDLRAATTGEETPQKERDLFGHLKNPDGKAVEKDAKPVSQQAQAYASIGDDFQLRTAYDTLRSATLLQPTAAPKR